MAIDSQHPRDLAGNLLVEFGKRARDLIKLAAAFRFEHGLAGVEEHFRLEHEPIPDNTDIRAIAENGAEASKEIRAVSREFLHALRQRQIEPRAQIEDARLRFLVARF